MPDLDPADVALGAAIRRRREAADLRQQEVADQAHMLNTVYSRIERGARPCRAVELRDIAAALDTTTDALLSETTEEPLSHLLRQAQAQFSGAVAALRDATAATERLVEAAVTEGQDREVVVQRVIEGAPHVDAAHWLFGTVGTAIGEAAEQVGHPLGGTTDG